MSLINDALKRAAESQGQAQAQTRPRGPKGIEDLPVPMTPVSARERPAWLPVVGIGLLIVVLLGASGFFFAKWWKERKAWQPYAETPDDDPATNAVAQGKSPPDTKQAKANTKAPPVTPPVTTNPVVKTNVEVAVVVPPKPVIPEPPSKATNPVVNVAVIPPAKQPEPVIPKPVVEPPPVTPRTNTPSVAKVETNQTVVIPPPVKPPPDTAKKGDDQGKTAAVEFPELKLQGIIRGKKKTTAIVNGKMLSLGDRLEGAFLLKIDQESVTFEKGSARRELFLLR